MANRERVKQTFLDLININSPSKHERLVADYVKAQLESLGFEVVEDNAGVETGGDSGNLIATKKGNVATAKSIFFSCHMDTVQPTETINIVMEDDLVKTDNTTILGADDKAGLAAVIEGIRSLVEDGKPHGDIQVLCDVQEEIGLIGIKKMDLSLVTAQMGYVFDTGKPVCGLTVSAPSHINMLIEIIGRASHAGIEPEAGVSAIIATSYAISKMKLGRIDNETTANVGVIEGGKARNIIPDRVIVKAEARSRNEDKLIAQVQHMKSLFEEEAARIGAVAEITAEREYQGFRWTQGDDIVKLAMAASSKIGIEPTFQDGGGGSDANLFNSAGIPALLIGVGYEGPHSTSERITLSDIEKAADLVSALVETAAESEA